jgi:aminoglycoside 6'-N-acetyltransferase
VCGIFDIKAVLMAEAHEAAGVGLRPATAKDHSLIRQWLGEPHVEAWWGNRASAEAELSLALASRSAICRVIEVEGVAIGYAHAVDTGLWGGALPADLPPGTWDADLFFGTASHRGRGIGASALRLLKDEVFSTTLAVGLCLFVSVRNEQAVRAYERAGFHWQRIWNDPANGPCWILFAERPVRS